MHIYIYTYMYTYIHIYIYIYIYIGVSNQLPAGSLEAPRTIGASDCDDDNNS